MEVTMTRLLPTRWVLLAALLSIASLACEPRARPEACTLDEECPAGQGCEAGQCVPVACREDQDCDAGERCVEHACQPPAECSQDRECELGEVCEQGQCVPGCRTDRDCPAGLRCLGAGDGPGQCAECLADGDCLEGERCIQGACRTSCQGAADCPGQHCDPTSQTCVDCLQDAHCAAGEICEGNACRPGCRSDRDCAAEHTCVEGVCVRACLTDADCPLEQYCAGGTCAPGCRDDHACPAGQICESHTCVSGCREDADCPGGQVCEGSACRPGCREDADCPGGQVCEGSACRPGCREDADCPGGTCDPLTRTCRGCLSNADCSLGFICLQDSCVPGCETERDCPAGQQCDQALGPHGTCVGCRQDADCPVEQICEDYQCRPGCREDADCPGGQICEGLACRPGCREDADCTTDPERPRCVDLQCTYECEQESDCAPGEVCVAHRCQTPVQGCALSLTPSAPVGFGEVAVGATRTVEVLLENAGLAPCTVSALQIRSTTYFPGDFLLRPTPSLPLVLAPAGQAGSRTRLELVFAPGVTGSHIGSLRLESDDPSFQVGAGETLCVLGGGVQPGQGCVPLNGQGVRLEVQAVPAAVDFGEVQAGCGSAVREVTIYNLGAAVEVTELALEGAGLGFRIREAPAVPHQLAAGGSFRVRLDFRPQGLGPALGMLRLGLAQGLTPEVPLGGLGVQGASVTDTHQLPATSQVDVLWVVDNSGSMAPIQSSLASNFSSFIGLADSLGIDYHVGVLATEVNEPSSGHGTPPREVRPGVLVQAPGRPRYITPSTPDRLAAFQDNVRVGDCCSDEQEAGLQATWMALSPPRVEDPEANAGFLRAGARLYAVFVSNEEDQSIGPWAFYLDFLRALKPTPDRVRLSSICGDVPGGCESGSFQAQAGTRYVAVQQATQGLFHSICSSNWSGLMGALGEQMAEPLRTFALSRQPAPQTLSVTVNGASVPEASTAYAPDGWTYEPGTNLVWFGVQVLPPLGSVLRISYTALCL
jgi:Cys-rich repeat protein